MTLWLVLASMTAVALIALVLPLVFGGNAVPGGSEAAVYQDQLLEIERDLKTGLIGTADAEAARVEVSRRLLNASAAGAALDRPQLTAPNLKARRIRVLAISLAFLPALAGSVYLRLGSPYAPSSRNVVEELPSTADDAKVDDLMVEVKSYLKDNPTDGRGWETLAPIYMHLQKYEEAARAWQSAIANLGDSAGREENLGEALFAAAGGIVTDEARIAFDRALSIDHDSVDARYYIGLAARQSGRREEAREIWQKLIDAAPPEADWIDTVRDALAKLDEDAVAPAASESTPQQAAMINSMVEGLAQRLKVDGTDPAGWLRLVRAYRVLGEQERENAALADARSALGFNPDKLAQFEKGLDAIGRAATDVAPGNSSTPLPADHNAEMRAVVDRMAERLKSTGGDVDSWLTLVRSYETLGQTDQATTATAQARKAFASDPEKLSQFNQLLGATTTMMKPMAEPAAKMQGPQPTADASASDQQAMIRGMVNRLAERLKNDGHDVDEWLQLMRSYLVLGQRDQANAAAKDARDALANNSNSLRRLTAGAKELGVDP